MAEELKWILYSDAHKITAQHNYILNLVAIQCTKAESISYAVKNMKS